MGLLSTTQIVMYLYILYLTDEGSGKWQSQDLSPSQWSCVTLASWLFHADLCLGPPSHDYTGNYLDTEIGSIVPLACYHLGLFLLYVGSSWLTVAQRMRTGMPTAYSESKPSVCLPIPEQVHCHLTTQLLQSTTISSITKEQKTHPGITGRTWVNGGALMGQNPGSRVINLASSSILCLHKLII